MQSDLVVDVAPRPLQPPPRSSPNFADGRQKELTPGVWILPIASRLAFPAVRWSRYPVHISPTCSPSLSARTIITPGVAPRLAFVTSALLSPSIAVQYVQTARLGFYSFYSGYAVVRKLEQLRENSRCRVQKYLDSQHFLLEATARMH